MTPTRSHTIPPADAGTRLDRWLKRQFPNLPHSHIEKLLRIGHIRLDEARTQASTRLAPGQIVTLPPAATLAPDQNASSQNAPVKKPPPPPGKKATATLRALVLYKDESIVAVNKPPGMAVQRGTKTPRSLDTLLEALRFDAPEAPRLIHRLDKDTSGVVLLGRSTGATAHMARAFRERQAHKLYWALTAGAPDTNTGAINIPVARRQNRTGSARNTDPALTRYTVAARTTHPTTGQIFGWIAFIPITGRKHQIRIHAAALGTPVVGDQRFGGMEAAREADGIAPLLHLHARAVTAWLPDGAIMRVRAPLPDHIMASLERLGLAHSALRNEDVVLREMETAPPA